MRRAEAWSSFKEIIGYQETQTAIGRLAISGTGFFIMIEGWASEPVPASNNMVSYIGFGVGIFSGLSGLDHLRNAATWYRANHPRQSSEEN